MWFPVYHMKILLSNYNAKLGWENIFQPTVQNENIHPGSNVNGIRLVNFMTLKNLIAKNIKFPHRNIHKCTLTSPDGITQNQ